MSFRQENTKEIYILELIFCRSGLSAEDFRELGTTFKSLEGSTSSLCRGPASLPVLAVDLQKSCDLLQVSTDDLYLICVCQYPLGTSTKIGLEYIYVIM